MKRVLSSAIILPVALIVFILGNKYIVDIFLSVISILCLYELFNAFEQKGHHPVKWVGYVAALTICFLHVIPKERVLLLIGAIIPTSVLLLFILTISKKTKTNVIDIAITFFGVCYIVLFLMFISLIRQRENGVWLIWYVFITSWITDVFAYLVGKTFGKHHFTDISPKKTVEGCVGGTIAAVIFVLIYTFILNQYVHININYIFMFIASIVLSIIGQIGDLSASVIKRYVGIKDYSNLIPGHGGMLDRIDSMLFIAPFTYFILLLI